MTTIYRNYQIAKVGEVYVAQSEDDECYMISKNLQRLNTAIDEVWSALEIGREPLWFSGSSAIDLDHLAIEAETLEKTPIAAAKPELVSKPRKIGYVTFFLTALAVAAPLSMICQQYLPQRVDSMLTALVCTVAVAFGRHFALIVSGIAAIAYNFFAVEPIYDITIPTFSEIGFSIMNLIASFGIPVLMRRRERIQAWWARRRNSSI